MFKCRANVLRHCDNASRLVECAFIVRKTVSKCALRLRNVADRNNESNTAVVGIPGCKMNPTDRLYSSYPSLFRVVVVARFIYSLTMTLCLHKRSLRYRLVSNYQRYPLAFSQHDDYHVQIHMSRHL